MKVALLTFLLAALGAMVVVRTSCAQTQQGSDFWPEIQLRYRIDGANQAIGMLRLRDNLDRGQLYRAELGVMFNHSFTDYFTGGIGYRHLNSIYGNAYEEDRAMGEQTFRIDFPSKVSVDFRTREDLRWLLSGFSARFRERAQVGRQIDIDDYVVTPYASVEVYFDTRYDQFSRYRLIFGTNLSAHRGFSVEPYFARQVDSVPMGSVLDIFGLVLIASF